MFIPTEFISLAHDRSGTPVVILREIAGNRELRMAVSPNDASRIAIFAFGMIKELASDLSQQIIDAFNSKISLLRITSEENRIIRCELFLDHSNGKAVVSPRPGEAVILAIQNKVPISVAEELFYTNKKVPHLRDKIRENTTLDFATYRLY